jgi:hypothetical protein
MKLTIGKLEIPVDWKYVTIIFSIVSGILGAYWKLDRVSGENTRSIGSINLKLKAIEDDYIARKEASLLHQLIKQEIQIQHWADRHTPDVGPALPLDSE